MLHKLKYSNLIFEMKKLCIIIFSSSDFSAQLRKTQRREGKSEEKEHLKKSTPYDHDNE